jgi:hypothetical protein
LRVLSQSGDSKTPSPQSRRFATPSVTSDMPASARSGVMAIASSSHRRLEERQGRRGVK